MNKKCLRTFSGHTECVNSVAIPTSRDGKYALSGSDDDTLNLNNINLQSNKIYDKVYVLFLIKGDKKSLFKIYATLEAAKKDLLNLTFQDLEKYLDLNSFKECFISHPVTVYTAPATIKEYKYTISSSVSIIAKINIYDLIS